MTDERINRNPEAIARILESELLKDAQGELQTRVRNTMTYGTSHPEAIASVLGDELLPLPLARHAMLSVNIPRPDGTVSADPTLDARLYEAVEMRMYAQANVEAAIAKHEARNAERVSGDELPPHYKMLVEQSDESGAWIRKTVPVWNLAGVEAAIAPYKAEIESLRTMLNTYNLGGWTDSHAILKRAEKAEAEIARLNAERATFYMDYRMKCDADIKDLHAEVERLRELLAEARPFCGNTATIGARIDAALKEKP